MKLILCVECEDVVKLSRKLRSCKCGRAKGMYLDNVKAVVNEDALVLGIDNNSLLDAIRFSDLDDVMSETELMAMTRIDAFIIFPTKAPNLKVEVL